MIQPRSIVLAYLPQSDLTTKLRPVVILSVLPGRYSDLLVCGISSKLREALPGGDEMLLPTEPRFQPTGLHVPSVIRLSHLSAIPEESISGILGELDQDTYRQLVERLRQHLALK